MDISYQLGIATLQRVELSLLYEHMKYIKVDDSLRIYLSSPSQHCCTRKSLHLFYYLPKLFYTIVFDIILHIIGYYFLSNLGCSFIEYIYRIAYLIV